MSEPIEIPHRQDDSFQIFLWSFEEFVPVVIGLTLGLFLGGFRNILFGILMGLAMALLYRRLTDNSHDGILLHFLYRLGLPFTKKKKNQRNRTFINPFIKRLFP